MKYVILLGLLFVARTSFGQQYPIDTLLYSGDPQSAINVVILGDGYTASEQQLFLSDAHGLTDYLLMQSPWSNYQAYFNVFAIEVPSTESGTSHPNTAPDCAGAGVPTISVNTRFGCSFDAFGIHRLVVPGNQVAISQILAANFPIYDQVLLIAHSPYYGGSGGAFATATVNTSSNEIVAHEIGHSFAGLADEYWAGPQYAAEKPNMTKESNPQAIRWKNWLTTGTGVSIYPHSGDPTWFKPSQSCKMEALGYPYCAVCSEAIVERIHGLANPIVSYSPKALSVDAPHSVLVALDTVLVPEPNTLRITWTLDGSQTSDRLATYLFDPTRVGPGPHTLVASVLDTTPLVRADHHFTDHIHSVMWTVNVTGSLVITSQPNSIALTLYPNPAVSELTIAVKSELPEHISVEIIATDGRTMWSAESIGSTSSFEERVPTATLPAGAYSVVYRVGSVVGSGKFVRE